MTDSNIGMSVVTSNGSGTIENTPVKKIKNKRSEIILL